MIQRVLNKLTTYEPPYQNTPNCLWNVGCQIVSILTFIDRCFCKVETRTCEKVRSCAKHLGGLAVATLPGASRSFNPALRICIVISQYQWYSNKCWLQGILSRNKIIYWSSQYRHDFIKFLRKGKIKLQRPTKIKRRHTFGSWTKGWDSLRSVMWEQGVKAHP